MTTLSPALLRALRDPAAPLPIPSSAAHAAALLRAHVLPRVARALHAGPPAMLVKGAALALTVYPGAASRPMADVDLLVRAADLVVILEALARADGTVHAQPDRPRTAAFLGETAVTFEAGALSLLVEVHTTLDKIVPRALDERALFARALPAPGLPGLLVPALEDHALLVALHAAGHDFHHPVALLDLELLLRRGLDLDELARRAAAFHLRTVMYVAFAELHRLGSASVTPAHVAAFAPGPLRRALVDRLYRAGVPAAPDRLGLPWILRQTPLRDDPAVWTAGLARYAAARARERLAKRGAGRQDAPVPYRVPLWARAFLAFDRVAARADSLRESLRDELFFAWIPPEDRAALTAAIYAEQATYLPGGHRFQSGLFPWEKRALDSPLFPRSGRILLGAAGAGRELVALVERGFDVVAFDPCAPFADAARGLGSAKATVLRASYADLVDAAQGRSGPLAPALEGPPFAAVILGWSSLSHVTPASARVALLRAVRALAPTAPVLASFGLEADTSAPPTSKGRVRDALRKAFSALHAPGISERGDHFYPLAGFFAHLGADEIVKLAWDAGYEVALNEDAPYAHAILVPLTPG